MDENSISIINRTNGQITGEKANALPVKITPSFSWVQYIIIGFLLAILTAGYFVWTIQKEVVSSSGFWQATRATNLRSKIIYL